MAAGRNASGGQLLLRQLRAIVGSVQPAHAFDRSVQVAWETAGIGADDRQVLSLRHFEFAHPETMANGHLRLRTFIRRTARFVCRATESKRVRWYEHHVRRGTLQQRAIEPVSCHRCSGINKKIVCGWQLHKGQARPGVGLGYVRAGLNHINAPHRSGDIHSCEQPES